VLAAVNNALELSQSIVEAEVGKVTGGLNIPGLFG
jgi:DNA-binding protein YbaB